MRKNKQALLRQCTMWKQCSRQRCARISKLCCVNAQCGNNVLGKGAQEWERLLGNISSMPAQHAGQRTSNRQGWGQKGGATVISNTAQGSHHCCNTLGLYLVEEAAAATLHCFTAKGHINKCIGTDFVEYWGFRQQGWSRAPSQYVRTVLQLLYMQYKCKPVSTRVGCF